MKNFIQKYAMAIVAVVTIVTFSAFKVSNVKSGKALFPVTVYFNGISTNNAQVEDEARWTLIPNGKNCNNATVAACAIPVDHTDLSGMTLDPAKITLGSTATTGGNYIPTKTGGSSTTPFNPNNRN